jgi:hypothetical protein
MKTHFKDYTKMEYLIFLSTLKQYISIKVPKKKK